MRAPVFTLLWLLRAVHLTPTTSHAAAATETQARGEATIEVVAIVSEGLDQPALLDALSLRLPELKLLDAGACGEGCVNVRVRMLAAPAASVMIEVFLEDGRVFVRKMSADGPEVERGVATLLAHLLTSIIKGDPGLVENDASPGSAGESVQEEPTVDLSAPSNQEPRAPAPQTPGPLPECTEPANTDEATSTSRAAPPTYELGPALGLVTVVGVGPPRQLAGRVGSGSLLDLELRSPSGLLLGASGRVLDARESGYRLTRLRFGFALGYGLRRGFFELRTLAMISVEPWWVGNRADGARTTYGQPLLGGSVIVAPGVHAALSDGLRIHAGLRVAASATTPPAGAGTLVVSDTEGNALFRLGGFEVSLLAEIGMRWGIRTRAQRATKIP